MDRYEDLDGMYRHPEGDWCRHEEVESVMEAKDARISDLERDLATRKADEAEAAGSLSVAIPEPGTDAAKLMILATNQRLREDDMKREVAEANANAAAWCQQAKDNAMEIDRLTSKIREWAKRGNETTAGGWNQHALCSCGYCKALLNEAIKP